MKSSLLLIALALPTLAQNAVDIPPNPVVPATARKFTSRSIGAGGSGIGVDVREIPRAAANRETMKREYIAVTGFRIWTSADGRQVRAMMLAYEEGSVPEAWSKPLTLIRDGKVRLLLDQRKQVAEYPLEKLSKEDREFVGKQVEAVRQASEAKAGK